MKTAWVFPGQGSQEVGMGSDLIDRPIARGKLEQAEEILGWSVLQMCQSDTEQLSRTLHTQPCLYVIESILADILQEEGHQPDLVAGHSLGEYVALYVAGVFDFETGLRLVKRRSELMDNAAVGKMVALMGFDRQKLEQAIDQTPNIVIANDNSAGQVAISGTQEAIETVLANVKVKRAVYLQVSGAFHSPLMAPVATEFERILDLVSFTEARCPVLSNVAPIAATDGELLKQRLVEQMTGSVRWRETCLQLPTEGIECVVEVGPGKVLTGLIKRTCNDLVLENISGVAQLPD